MPPRKLEEIPVAVRMKVVEAYKTEKNRAEIRRLFGISRTNMFYGATVGASAAGDQK